MKRLLAAFSAASVLFSAALFADERKAAPYFIASVGYPFIDLDQFDPVLQNIDFEISAIPISINMDLGAAWFSGKAKGLVVQILMLDVAGVNQWIGHRRFDLSQAEAGPGIGYGYENEWIDMKLSASAMFGALTMTAIEDEPNYGAELWQYSFSAFPLATVLFIIPKTNVGLGLRGGYCFDFPFHQKWFGDDVAQKLDKIKMSRGYIGIALGIIQM